MKLQPSPFEKIQNGSKTIEIRLNDEKRKLVKVGDEIEFSLMTDPSQTLRTEVLELQHFPTFQELFAAFPPEQYGGVSKDEYSTMYKYYPQEDEEKYGVLAIRVKRLGKSVSFELAKQYLGREVEVVMDRALGSKHPKHGFIYEANYGFIEGIKAPDGEDLDAYFLGVHEPLERAKGTCIAIAHRKDNDDDKLIVVPTGMEMTDGEIMSAIHFQEQWFDTQIVRNGGEQKETV